MAGLPMNVPAAEAPWEEIRSFALSFDGYEAAGSFDACSALGNAVRKAWMEQRTLPLSPDVLRTALFWEQRRQWHVDDSGGPSEPDSTTLEYVRDLLAELGRYARKEAVHDEQPATSAKSVAAALLEYGRRQVKQDPAAKPSFTPDEDANAFLLDNPFAFLLGVIFDEGIPAERAWAAPYELYRRLGHLDLERLVADAASVKDAVSEKPALHRFTSHTPRRIVAAAHTVLRDYGGDAARIWNDTPTAVELHRRLDAFEGIGQKKAAMAVEILRRDFGIKITAVTGTQIAYDIHVRRVFLRTAIADVDDPTHMVDAARRLHPEHPAALDYPAWLIGRQWCRAGIPDCPRCVLSDVCPKLVDRAATVTSA